MPALSRRTAGAALAVALLAGCSSSADEPAVDDRVGTIQELRRTVGPPAVTVGSAAATVAERLDDLHATWPAQPEGRARTIEDLTTEVLPTLEDALDGYGPELAGDATGPDADATREALEASAAAAAELRDAAVQDLELAITATEAEVRLRELVATWEEPGSRNEQLQRLDATAGGATALAGELAAIEDVPGCAGLVQRREEAALAVAAATRELRELVADRRGTAFDERRDELLQDPYGTGRALAEADRGDLDCWRREGPVPAAAAEVEAALGRLEEALNPSDLATD